MAGRNAEQGLLRQVQYPIRDNRADLRPRASDHAGKHFDVGTPARCALRYTVPGPVRGAWRAPR